MRISAKKLLTDVLLLALLLSLMAAFHTGNAFHEWAGTVLIAGLILHNVLVAHWGTHFISGKGGATLLRTAFNLFILAAAFVAMVSGILISQTVFRFLPIEGSLSVRQIHTASAYWFLILAGIHIGTQWKCLTARISAITGIKLGKRALVVSHVAACTAALYGLVSFVRRDIADRLTMQVSFSFPLEGETLLSCMTDHLFLICLFAVPASYLARSLDYRQQTSATRSAD